MTAMVDSLLNVSQLELGGFSIKPYPINLGEHIHNILGEELKQAASDKKLHSEEHYDQAIGSMLLDPDIIKIIFRNLITNAIKYTPKDGKISIILEGSSEGILCKIIDTGCGIPKDQQEKIFTKLFRAENGKEKDTDGMGLGLFIVKGILEQIGGKIWFETEENKGSTFFVMLPREGMKERKGEKSLVVEPEK
jgi:signal transduction histidine kinase